MKIEGMQHLPPGQRAKLAQYKMLSRPVAKAAGTLLRFPTEWQPGKAPRNPRDLIVDGIHEDLFMGRFCDFYIGGRKA